MKILVCSCDKNEDTFELFHHCMEKYYPNHPEVIYSMETLQNPYYKTICKNYPLNQWTRRIRETLEEINDDKILLMIDDLFIRKRVDTDRIEDACSHLHGNIALMNFEKTFDLDDKETNLIGWYKRPHPSPYELSLMCGLWPKDKLITVLEEDSDPWEVEIKQDTKGFDYLINSGDYIIDFGYKTFEHCGIKLGKWCRNTVPFAEKEGIHIDFEKRGFYD